MFQLLEARGLEVYLVNAHPINNVPGRKSDASDCKWIQFLHSVGLLKASFCPPEAICAVTYTMAALWKPAADGPRTHPAHLEICQSDEPSCAERYHGVSGQADPGRILGGERDPVVLAQLCHSWRSPREKWAQALEGDYRPEHLFTWKQSLRWLPLLPKLIAELDRETARLMRLSPVLGIILFPRRTKHTFCQRQGNEPIFNLRSELYRIAGVHLTVIPSISATTAQLILTEIGPGVPFRNASAFASWIGLCPEKRVSAATYCLVIRAR